MKLLGKHIFRSIKARPYQPLVITLIISICVAVMIISVILPINIYKNESEALGVDAWTPDLTVSLKATSDLRLLFEDDVEAAIDECGEVLGEFSLTGFSELGDEDGNRVLIEIGAFDFEKAYAFYGIKFTENEKITNKNLDTSAVVSSWFAKEQGLSLGDVLKVNVLGQELSYTVRGIAESRGFFKAQSVMVDVSSIKDALKERSAIIASLPSDINPFTKVHVRVADGYSPLDLKAQLESESGFENKKITLVADTTRSDFFTTVLTMTVLIPAGLLLIVASMMIVSTFELMTKKRQSELALFRMVGADSHYLDMMTYFENGIYAVLGGVIGSLVSIPIIAALNRIYSFRYTLLKFGLCELAIGIGSSLLFTFICTLMHIRRQRARSIISASADVNVDTGAHFTPKKIIYAAPLAVIIPVLLILPARYKYIPAVLLLINAVVLLYVISPYLIGAFSSLILRLVRQGRRGTDLVLVANSCKNSYPLRHAGRIMTVLVTMFISLSTVLTCTERHLSVYLGLGSFDYAGVAVDSGTYDKLQELDGVVAIADAVISRNVFFEGGLSATGISVKGDRQSCFNDEIIPDQMPTGDSIMLSIGVAKMIEAGVGDRIKCEIDGIPCEFTITQIVRSYGDFAFYDAEYVGVEYATACIRTDGSDEARQRVISLLDERGISYVSNDEYFASTYERVVPPLVVLRAMFYAIILMTAVGICNVLSEQNMARRKEFQVLIQNGKTRRGTVRLCALETAFLLLFAVLISAVFSQAICLAIDIVATSFGMKLYI